MLGEKRAAGDRAMPEGIKESGVEDAVKANGAAGEVAGQRQQRRPARQPRRPRR